MWTPTWITLRDCSSMMKKANSERKKRSGTGRRVARPDLLGRSVQEGLPGLSSWPAGAHGSHVLLNGPLADADAQFEEFTTKPFCSPQSVVPCHFIDQGDGLCGYPWCGRSCLGLGLPQELKALTMPPQQRLWLNDEEGLFPGPHYACQQDQEYAVRLGTGRPFHLTTQDDQLLTQQGVFCHKLGLAPGKVDQRPQLERGCLRCGPGDEEVVERPKTISCQPRDEGENPVHSRRYPFVKMSESMLEIVHFLWGIGKKQKTA